MSAWLVSAYRFCWYIHFAVADAELTFEPTISRRHTATFVRTNFVRTNPASGRQGGGRTGHCLGRQGRRDVSSFGRIYARRRAATVAFPKRRCNVTAPRPPARARCRLRESRVVRTWRQSAKFSGDCRPTKCARWKGLLTAQTLAEPLRNRSGRVAEPVASAGHGCRHRRSQIFGNAARDAGAGWPPTSSPGRGKTPVEVISNIGNNPSPCRRTVSANLPRRLFSNLRTSRRSQGVQSLDSLAPSQFGTCRESGHLSRIGTPDAEDMQGSKVSGASGRRGRVFAAYFCAANWQAPAHDVG